MEIDLAVALIGRDKTRSFEGLAVAGGAAVLTLLISLLPVSVGILQELGVVGVLVGVAGWWAYWNSGLLVSVSHILGPVVARLAYWDVYYTVLQEGRGEPVGMAFSFGGHGAWAFWIPVAMLLGFLAFGTGVLTRWTHRVVTSTPRQKTQK